MLNGYKRVSSEATKEGQVISSGMVDSFRSNDALFEGILKALLCNPLMASGFDRDQPESGKPLDPYAFINAQLLEINSEVNLDAGIPLIWFARQKIILNAKINANGKGAQPGESGDFGGAGGRGSTEDGKNCYMPYSGALMASGGTTAKEAEPLAEIWASRAFSLIACSKGGASGGGKNSDGNSIGGSGGGVVMLCAPVIEFGTSASIEAMGNSVDVGVGGGGGGGGLVILIANNFYGNYENKIKVTGGTGVQAGGTGWIFKKEFK